jgi:DNA-binding Xre family transcriptional regulator
MHRELNLNNVIREKRLGLGLNQRDLAVACGMSEHEYRDLEDYDDEFYMVVKLSDIICVCNKLGINLAELFGFSSVGGILPTDAIYKRMQEKRVSISKLSDVIGIEESYIDKIKSNLVKIEEWVLDPILSLSKHLEINLGTLLNSVVEYRQE